MLTVIVPTWNEAPNIASLVVDLRRALNDAGYCRFEILVMDDCSEDGTARCAIESGVHEVRVIDRCGRPRGLAPAVMDGFREARGEIVAVLDADSSHPPEVLPELVRAIEAGALVAIGSRYVPGGGSMQWPFVRRFMSRAACLIARPVTSVRDATSGFFAVRRSVVDVARLNPKGFKIGLEILLKGEHEGRVREVPFVFRNRTLGSSKLRPRHVFAFLCQIAFFAVKRGVSSAPEPVEVALEPSYNPPTA